MDVLKTIAKRIKQIFDDPKFLLTLVVTTLFLLFAPPNWLRMLGVDLFVAEYRWLIGAVCLFAGASFFATISSSIIDSFAARQIEKSSQNEVVREVNNLTDDD